MIDRDTLRRLMDVRETRNLLGSDSRRFIRAIVDKYGSYRKAAKILEIDHAFLWNIEHGERPMPVELAEKIAKDLTGETNDYQEGDF